MLKIEALAMTDGSSKYRLTTDSAEDDDGVSRVLAHFILNRPMLLAWDESERVDGVRSFEFDPGPMFTIADIVGAFGAEDVIVDECP